MLDEKDFQDTIQLLSEKFELLRQGQEAIMEKLVTHKDVAHIMNMVVENEVTPKLDLLAEGHQTLLDNLTPKSEIEDLRNEIDLLKMVIRTMSADIAELKQAQ